MGATSAPSLERRVVAVNVSGFGICDTVRTFAGFSPWHVRYHELLHEDRGLPGRMRHSFWSGSTQPTLAARITSGQLCCTEKMSAKFLFVREPACDT